MLTAEKVFGKDGIIAGVMKGYESRQQQSVMFDSIVEAIDKKHHLMVEAGTGVGKTFAYLVPAIEYSLAAKKPVVVSTYTINLQEQIFYKDIPFLKSAIGIDFKSALVKGRSNYLCLRRLNRTSNFQSNLFENSLELEEIKRIREWALTTADGSVSSLNFVPSDRIWSMIACETDNCSGKKCVHYHDCFYRKARASIWNANIIVTNHALLLLDALLRKEETSLLPDFDTVIIDEAHRLERVAQDHMGAEITTGRVNYLFNSIYNPSKTRGFLSFIPPRIQHLKETKNSLLSARENAEFLFASIIDWFNKDSPENGRIRNKNFILNTLSPALSKLAFDLKELKTALNKKKPSGRKGDTRPNGSAGRKEWDDTELSAYINRTASLALELDNFINQSEDNHVYWAEVERRKSARQRIGLKSAPIEVAQYLKPLLFDRISSAVLTSATLATNSQSNQVKEKGFRYLKQMLGIDKPKEIILGSSFDYAKQVTLYVASKLPDPNNKDIFIPALSEKIIKYLTLSKGSAFVLFTNYDLMNRVHERINPELERTGMLAIVQGRDLPRHRMLEEFKSRVGSVIFGAASFWEGVDVPGAALENIIITKLPFPVPSEPVSEAKIEYLERRGLDSFKDYFMPEAILKLRQGFGRLIRTNQDKGIVVILDSRVVNKQYGKQFLDALPKCPVIIDRE